MVIETGAPRPVARQSSFDFNLMRAMEVFATVVETRNVTRAAELLGMTQSAASQQLRNLEGAFDTRVFDRSARPLELTPAGIALHRRALHILGQVDDLKADLRRLDAAPLPLLRVGVLASIATTLTPAILALARDRFAIPEVSLYAGLGSDHAPLLRGRQADLVISSDPLFDLDGLVRLPILRERFLLVTPKAFAGPRDSLPALARQLPLVRFGPDTPTGRRIDQHLRRIRLPLPRAIEADRASMVLAAVGAGRGFALASPTLLIDGLVEGLPIAVHPLPAASLTRDITLVAREKELGELPEALAREIARVLAKAIRKALPHVPEDTVDLGTAP